MTLVWSVNGVGGRECALDFVWQPSTVGNPRLPSSGAELYAALAMRAEGLTRPNEGIADVVADDVQRRRIGRKSVRW